MQKDDDALRAGMGAPARIVMGALEVIEGESRARAYLDRLRDGIAQPGELAALLCYLRGELLYGACRLIEKALEGNHRA